LPSSHRLDRYRSGAQVKTIAVRGTELTYLDMGQGPPVVMVHGTFCDYRWWQPQMDEFSQRCVRSGLGILHSP